MPSTDQYDAAQREILHGIARDSIVHGLEHGTPLAVSPGDYSPDLGERRASFVTLNKKGQLRGCIGMLQAVRPLVEDIAENAYAAAFSDPRFPALAAAEFAELDIHLSILSPSSPLEFDDEADLLEKMRPGIDGLILSSGNHRGTFLPSVWEQLPTAPQFLAHLKQKAGLPANYWSDDLRVQRYTTESF